ncbi:MAG: aspartate aminotransferase family protein [Planctomycetota bacterium]
MNDALYARHVNDQWVAMMDVLGMEKDYASCEGTTLTTHGGRKILDFLSGYCVYNTGHNHPRLIAALKAELDAKGPTMLQSHVPPLAGPLAERLSRLAGGRLTRTVFTSTGSEGVETAIKFSRAFTGRAGILYAKGAFHGLTCGALSLMGDNWWRADFEPLLPGAESIDYLDLTALEEKLITKKFASFIVEPIQSESGVNLPAEGAWKKAQEICRRHGTLLVFDEVQTGMGRTGKFLAAHHYGVNPDMVILAKALSGGLMPVGAVLMREDINRSVYSNVERSFLHASTFGENSLSMRAALIVLDILEDEGLMARSLALGERLREGLGALAARYEMVVGPRGMGLMNGVEFRRPESLRLRFQYDTFARLHPGLFGQMLVRTLFRDEGILTQMCGNNYSVIKASPPLTSSEAEIDAYIAAMDRVMEAVHSGASFWAQGLVIAGHALKAKVRSAGGGQKG